MPITQNSARIFGGLLLYPTAPVYHYWLEAFGDVAGWRPYDLLGWDLAGGDLADPRLHTLFGQGWGRVTTQIFPAAVTGSMGVNIPATWRILQRGVDGGSESTIVAPGDGDGDTGVVVRDRIQSEGS